MFRRNGMTLMEVLIAIFVMGIGLLSVLALFPLGASSMARAIKDDRAGHAGANAKAIGIAQNIRFDPLVVSKFSTAGLYDGYSNAVYADPVGYLSYSNIYKNTIAGSTGIARCQLSFANNSATMLKWCTLLDDITFGPNGTPSMASGFVERGSSVSWAWLLQRPRLSNASCCNMSVVIYNQRPLTTAGVVSGREVAYANCPLIGPSQVKVSWGNGLPQPQVSEGGWVLDATPNASGPCNATFYRVVSVTEVNSFQAILEMAEPFQGTSPTKTIVVMDGIVEVLDCGTGWRSSPN